MNAYRGIQKLVQMLIQIGKLCFEALLWMHVVVLKNWYKSLVLRSSEVQPTGREKSFVKSAIESASCLEWGKRPASHLLFSANARWFR